MRDCTGGISENTVRKYGENTETMLENTDIVLENTEIVLENTETMLENTEIVLKNTELIAGNRKKQLNLTKSIIQAEQVCYMDHRQNSLHTHHSVLTCQVPKCHYSSFVLHCFYIEPYM